MSGVLRHLAALSVGLALAAGALAVVFPGADVDTEVAFDAAALPDDLDVWLAAREAVIPDLRPDDAKRIVWAGAPGRRTALALVYLHGFSAGPAELSPVPTRVAEALGANLFLQRLAGHGRDGAAMAEPEAGDWIEDAAEAMAIARRLGDRVVVIGTSTGGTLAATLAVDPALAEQRAALAGVALISPNFGVRNAGAELLTWPAARHWAPLIAGETRGFEPRNEEHAAHWTEEYPTVAAIPMQALVAHAAALDWRSAGVPALIYYSPRDAVVLPGRIEAVAAAWGAPATLVAAEPAAGGTDPNEHVLAGDILSPARTDRAVALLTEWIGGL
jgi:alpha-beta hydrolase superfamily lysophospholipase